MGSPRLAPVLTALFLLPLLALPALAAPPGARGLTLADLDTTVAPCQDFYRYARGSGFLHWDGATQGDLTTRTAAGLLLFTTPDSTRIAFNAEGRLETITDKNGQAIAFSYTDGNGVAQVVAGVNHNGVWTAASFSTA